MAKKQQERRYGPALWADQVEAPRADLRLPGDGSRTLAVYKAGIYASLIGVPLLLILCIAMLSKISGAPANSANPQAQHGQVSVQGRAQATIAVTEWLAESPPPLPGGRLIAWAGSRPVSVPEADADNADGDDGVENDPASLTTYEIQSFTVADGSGKLYTASVEVATDGRPGGGSKVISGVSLIPDTPVANDGWSGDSPWPGLATVSTPGPVATAVGAWATAYASGDSATLGQAIGDPDPSHSYIPMSGASSIVATPIAAAWTDATKTVMTVQVSLDITWGGQPPRDPDSAQQPVVDTVLDVLVEKADTAAPVVVAWSAPGSGPSLTPYVNAVSNKAPRELPTTGADSSGITAPGTTWNSPSPGQAASTSTAPTSQTAPKTSSATTVAQAPANTDSNAKKTGNPHESAAGKSAKAATTKTTGPEHGKKAGDKGNQGKKDKKKGGAHR